MAAFEEFGVMPEIIRALEDIDWTLPTPIQADAIPLILGGGDVLAAAETGSGKTGAFAIPLIQVTHESVLEGLHTSSTSTSTSSTSSSDESMKMNQEDRDSGFAIAENGQLCQSREEQWKGGRASRGILSGKYYYEATVTDEGLCRVGWSTRAARLDLGTDRLGFGFGGTGKKSNNKAFENYGQTFGLNDTITCAIDLDNLSIRFYKNGTDLGQAFTIPKSLSGSGFFPACVVKNAEIKFNFGPDVKHKIDGFTCISSADPSHLVSNNSSTSSSSSSSSSSKPNVRKPTALILEPSRELAEQTHNNIISFSKHLPPPLLRHVLLVGGVPLRDQEKAMEQGADIITATPGRLQELLKSGVVDLSNIRFFVIDEADSLINSNSDLLTNIHQRLPTLRLQVLFFSATLHSFPVRKMAESITRFPTWVDLKGADSVPETVDHACVHVTANMINPSPIQTDGIHKHDQMKQGSKEYISEAIKRHKGEILCKILEAQEGAQAIIFARTKLDCDHIEHMLHLLGGGSKGPVESRYSCVVLHSDRPPPQRKENLRKFKQAEVRLLICTDVAARGIDIQELPFMINYTLPDKPEDYIHRVGRVGRADRMGLAISLVGFDQEKVWYHTCSSKTCNNTKLTTEGGCAIWYDEPLYFQEIQKRLGQTVQALDSSYHPLGKGNSVYGKARGGSVVGSGYEFHVDQIKSQVVELSKLEDGVQKNYWNLRTKYTKAIISSSRQ
eukprot:TRINITY_DN2783_c0_g1_i3.p1 TRINITY_DN2783_c0_g1~~TRINITY_DN2783_c0_g1_i3.p1  ORF type:complete len:728 (+),score=242.80 TRINITY_DN2783_c0_g1_i3:111-2294(+)